MFGTPRCHSKALMNSACNLSIILQILHVAFARDALESLSWDVDTHPPMGKQKEAKRAESGAVDISTISPGDGVTFPSTGDIVSVHYVGTLLDGTEFDSSRAKEKPFSFGLGSSAVIHGWELGIPQLSLGQRATLTIGAGAAYGSRGHVDKEGASGTGVIPPGADLRFDVELLDINHTRTLERYRLSLAEWMAGKLVKFDGDVAFAAKMGAKHGERRGYERHLQASVEEKFEAERAKRQPHLKAPTTTDSTQATADDVAKLAIADAPTEAAVKACDTTATSETAGDGDATAAAAAEAALSFDSRFATIKVEPNDADEAKSPKFPRSLHNAAELFSALGHGDSARRLHTATVRTLEVLELGPDGRSSQAIGRACICWACGHVGIPRNAAKCSDTGPKPAGKCGACGSADQTNFVRVMRPDGSSVPWIEPKGA